MSKEARRRYGSRAAAINCRAQAESLFRLCGDGFEVPSGRTVCYERLDPFHLIIREPHRADPADDEL